MANESTVQRVPAELDRHVRRRAGDRCEYCLTPQSVVPMRLPIDHIIARQHRGKTVEDNLALSCPHCNTHKGPNLATLDPDTDQLTRLFNPRHDAWAEHFAVEGVLVLGRTDIGRATVALLDMNHSANLSVREELMEIDQDLRPPRQ